MKKTQESSEGVPGDEIELGTVVAWYFRLLYSQELDRGVTQAQFSLKSGIHKSRLSRLRDSAEGTGMKFLTGFSRYFGRTEGTLLDEALRWWNLKGREYAQREADRKHAEDKAELDRRARRTASSERLIAIPSHLRSPSDPAGPVAKK